VGDSGSRRAGFRIGSRGQSGAVDEVRITAYPDGPYLVRGPVTLTDERGEEIELRRRTIALCRCGRSRILPFCDGTHKSVGGPQPVRPNGSQP
jgi:hypothetical protein